jgi:virginiamycin B lyase
MGDETPPAAAFLATGVATGAAARPALRVQEYPVPAGSHPHDVAPARDGGVWYTAQAIGKVGWLDPATGKVREIALGPRSAPHSVIVGPDASLAGSHIARIDTRSGKTMQLRTSTPDQAARRIWSDSRGRLWISEWNAGKLGMYDPARRRWREWRLPGRDPQPYAIYVDERDLVWMSDCGANALVRFDPRTSGFRVLRLPTLGAAVRQLLGRRDELWAAESAVDKLVVVRRL